MTNLYCVNDNPLQSDLQTNARHFTSFHNIVKKKQWKMPQNVEFDAIVWSVTDKFGNGDGTEIDMTKPFHMLKGRYQGLDIDHKPVQFEVLLTSCTPKTDIQRDQYYKSINKQIVIEKLKKDEKNELDRFRTANRYKVEVEKAQSGLNPNIKNIHPIPESHTTQPPPHSPSTERNGMSSVSE
jgi:hypothetical protein